jgi:hypothetical protein
MIFSENRCPLFGIMLYFFAQISTAGAAGVSPPVHRTTRSPSGVGTVFAPQNAPMAISSAAQPSRQLSAAQSRRRTAAPGSPLSPFAP